MCVCVCVCVCVCELGDELRASQFLSRSSTTCTMPLILFALVILGIGSPVYTQAILDHNPPIYTLS
jgi:hypothetical protein